MMSGSFTPSHHTDKVDAGAFQLPLYFGSQILRMRGSNGRYVPFWPECAHRHCLCHNDIKVFVG